MARIRCCSDLFEGGGGVVLLQWWWRCVVAVVVRCLRSRWRCSLHLVCRSRWRDDGGPHMDVRSRFAQVVDLCFYWLQVVDLCFYWLQVFAQWCIVEKKTKLWSGALLPTRVAAAMVMERDDEN